MPTTMKLLPKHGGGTFVHFQHRDTMRKRLARASARLPVGIPPTVLPVDCSGNAGCSWPMDGNDNLGDCMEAMACHVDNVWTYGRGQAGWTESVFDQIALQNQYLTASGGDNGLDEPTLLQQCWAPGLAGVAAATYVDSLDVDVTNVPLAQYLIDQFFHINLMWSVPDDFLANFATGTVWPNAGSPDPSNGHGTPLTDLFGPSDSIGGVNVNGFMRLVTWGGWAAVSPAFVASVDPACFVVLSARQFNASGFDAHGRHVTEIAKAWIGIGGDAAKANALAVTFPPPSPVPPIPPPVPPVPPTPGPDPVGVPVTVNFPATQITIPAMTLTGTTVPTGAGVIPWLQIWQFIQSVVKLYGPLAVPYIEAWLATLNLPASVLPILDAFIEFLLGKPAKRKLDAKNCRCRG